MRTLLKLELHKLISSHSLMVAGLICVLSACITNFVVAGAPESPFVYSVAFEFYIPFMLVFILPTLYIAAGLRKGEVKSELVSGEKKYKVFISKTIIYYFALFVILNMYLILLTLMNAKGVGVQQINGENSLVYFLRCASSGFAYCFMLASILLLISVLFKNPLATLIGSVALCLIEFLLRSTVSWRVTDRVVPSLMIESIANKTDDTRIIVGFALMIIILTVASYVAAMLIYCKRSDK